MTTDLTGTGVGGSTPSPENSRVGEYLDRVASHDVQGARALVLSELTTGGDGLIRVIDELLVPAMAEVGIRWYDGRWNAAQEHVACGITEGALSAASVRTRRHRPPTDAPQAILACPRGEAHVLPARFAAEHLVEAGAEVILLGLPVPDQDLADFLEATRPCALIVSCTDSLALPGVRDAIAAAHRVGVPALAGGAGMGPDGRRGRAVGADGWASRPPDAVALLNAWREHPPALAEAAPEDPEVVALQELHDRFVDDTLRSLLTAEHGAEGRGPELEHARTDLKLVISSLACALLGGDARVFTDIIGWSRGRLGSRRAHWVVEQESLAVISAALGPDFPGAQRLLAG